MQQFGPYRIFHELGRGASGVVYRAQDQRNGATVALKILLDTDPSPVELERFSREALALKGVAHPNLVQVLALNPRPPHPYVAFEYVPGETLRARVEREGPLNWREAVRVVSDLARGLAVAHDRHLIHRDVKPANVLLAEAGAKLADFGLVKDFDAETLTRTGTVLGTPAFMAPEQVDGLRGGLSKATDVYGLAATLHYALTGVPPFSGKTVFETVVAVKTARPVAPRKLVAEIPEWLDTVVQRGLAKDPAERYPSALALRAALGRGLREAARPAQAGVPWYAIASALMLVGALVVGAVTGLYTGHEQAGGAVDARVGEEQKTTLEHLRQARYQRDAGELSASLRDYTLALEQRPDDPTLLEERGAVQLKLGLAEQALRDINRAIELEISASRFAARAQVRIALREHQRALDDLDRAVELDPSPERLLARADLRASLNRATDAIQDCDRVLEVEPNHLRALELRGFYWMGLDRLPEALVSMNRAIELGSTDAITWSNRGAILMRQGQHDRALQDLERAVQFAPDNALLRFNLGAAQENQGLAEKALESYTRSLSIDPSYLNARLELCELLQELGRHGEALAEFSRGIVETPNRPELYEQRARIYFGLNQVDQGFADLNRALELRPTAVRYAMRASAYQQLGRDRDALADVERAFELDPSVDTLRNRARLRMAVGRQEDALADFERVLRADPQNAEVLGQCLAISRDLKRYEEALEFADRLLELHPRDALTYQDRVDLFARLQRHDEALAAFARAVQLQPRDAKLLQGYIQYCFQLQRWPAAESALGRLNQLAPNTPEVFRMRGVVRTHQGRFQDALADLDRALELDPSNVQAIRDRASALHGLKRDDEALAGYERVLELRPEDLAARVARAGILNNAGRYEEAYVAFGAVLELAPKPEYHWARGRSALSLERFEEALADFERAVELGPEVGAYYHARAQARAGLGQTERALADYDRALERVSDEEREVVQRARDRLAAAKR